MESKERHGVRALYNEIDTTEHRGFLERGAGLKAHQTLKKVSNISEDIPILVLYKNLVSKNMYICTILLFRSMEMQFRIKRYPN